MRFYIFIIILQLLSCVNRNIDKKCINSFDTVKVNSDNNSNDIRFDTILNKYRNISGVIIQNYYTVEDSLSMDLNNDSQKDLILILTPISLLNEDIPYNLIEENPNRLFVEVEIFKSFSKIRQIRRNLINNIGGVLSKYSGIKQSENCIEISHESGNRYRWLYTYKLSTMNSDSLSLIKIYKECSFADSSVEYTFYYDFLPLNLFNINDSININCDCNNSWEYFEQNIAYVEPIINK